VLLTLVVSGLFEFVLFFHSKSVRKNEKGKGWGMLGRRKIRDSIGYVTLGLFTNALLVELLEARRNPQVPPTRNRMIAIASDSLQAVKSPEEVESSRWRDLVFQNYQEARTLHTVLLKQSVDDVDLLRETLDRIIKADTTSDTRVASADSAIEFFGELARMAVINAECPEEQVPPGVRQLVS